MKIRILIVDDYEIVREGLRLMIQKEADLEAVGGASDGSEAVEQAVELLPDVVLMDMELGDMDGIEASRQILAKNPQTRILILSGLVDANAINDGIAAGVKGFMLKTNASRELIHALRAVAQGHSYLCPEASSAVVNNYKGLLSARVERVESALTGRERDVLKLTAEGCRLKDIAHRLNIGVKTVETHRSHLMKKLVCSSSAELTRYAIREGISPI